MSIIITSSKPRRYTLYLYNILNADERKSSNMISIKSVGQSKIYFALKTHKLDINFAYILLLVVHD